jgi:hypothetical protein
VIGNFVKYVRDDVRPGMAGVEKNAGIVVGEEA